MPEALVIAGNEKWHLESARAARAALKRLGLGQVHIAIPHYSYGGMEDLRTCLRAFVIRQSPDSPFLLAYMGHGDEKGWWLGKEQTFSYEDLSSLLVSSLARPVILNDACHSGALIDLLQKNSKHADHMLVIASCAAAELSYAGMIDTVLARWEHQDRYIPTDTVTEVIELWDPDLEEGKPACEWIGNEWRINSIPSKTRKIGETIEKTLEIRWGADLDSHFFPAAN